MQKLYINRNLAVVRMGLEYGVHHIYGGIWLAGRGSVMVVYGGVGWYHASVATRRTNTHKVVICMNTYRLLLVYLSSV